MLYKRAFFNNQFDKAKSIAIYLKNGSFVNLVKIVRPYKTESARLSKVFHIHKFVCKVYPHDQNLQ